MNSAFFILLALGVIALLVWSVTHRRPKTNDDVIGDHPYEGDIKPRILSNRYPKDDPCRPLDMPDQPYSNGAVPCPAVQEAVTRLADLPPVVAVTPPKAKVTPKEALQAANRNRQSTGRLKAQKAKDALDAKEDPEKVASECGYKTVKYMREKVRELERESLPT